MKLKIFFSTIFFILLASQTIAQTKYYRTFKVSGSNKSITFEVTPQSVNINSIYDNNIRYDINYKIKIITSNMPQQSELRNVFIQFQGSQNASEGQSWPDFSKTQLPASGTYEEPYNTSNNPVMTGTSFSQLKDQSKSNNTSILPIANYNAVNLQFTMADNTRGQYQVFTFDNYNTATGEKLIPSSIVLPVTLSNFSAKQENKSVLLNWATSSEINNNYFVLERSIDSKKFDSITQIKGAGNSSNDNNYTFKDYNYTSSINYYRLKQVDFDGAFTYSNIVSIDMSNQGANGNALNVYPNPGNGNITIGGNYSLYKNVVVYNMLGAVVETKSIYSNQLQLSSSLPSGIYLVNFVDQLGKQQSIKYQLRK